MCFSILKEPKLHFSLNTPPNELKICTLSKQGTGNPNPASKWTAESELTNKSVINVVLKVKIDLIGLKLETYSNW